MIIKKTQTKVIGPLTPEQTEVLLDYGTDMFKRGMFHGAIWSMLGVILGGTAMVALSIRDEDRKHEKKENEEES